MVKPSCLWILVGLTAVCCKPGNGKVVARVGDSYLYEARLTEMLPPGLPKADSMMVRDNYIRQWIQSQLLYDKGMKELSATEKNKTYELNDYYRSLIRHTYEKKLLAKSGDVQVTERDIQKYYGENLKNFELKRNILRLLYVKVPLNNEHQNALREWVRYPSPERMDSLSRFVGQYAINYSLDTTKWFYFEDITKEVPIIESYSPGHFLKGNDFVELNDSVYSYYINIIDKRIKDDVAPLQLVRSRIQNILTNQFRIDRVKEIENKMFRDGLLNNQVEIFNNEN